MKLSETKLLLITLTLVPLGFAVKFAVPGPLGTWCRMYGAGVLYKIFWILALRLFFRRLTPAACGIIVFAITCVLEFMQLWHPPLLEAVRSTFLGAALIGTTFDPVDFAYYAVGSLLGFHFLKGIVSVAGRGP